MAYYSGQCRRIIRTAAQVSKEPVSLPMSDCHSPFLNLVEDTFYEITPPNQALPQSGVAFAVSQQAVALVESVVVQTVFLSRGLVDVHEHPSTRSLGCQCD